MPFRQLKSFLKNLIGVQYEIAGVLCQRGNMANSASHGKFMGTVRGGNILYRPQNR